MILTLLYGFCHTHNPFVEQQVLSLKVMYGASFTSFSSLSSPIAKNISSFHEGKSSTRWLSSNLESLALGILLCSSSLSRLDDVAFCHTVVTLRVLMCESVL